MTDRNLLRHHGAALVFGLVLACPSAWAADDTFSSARDCLNTVGNVERQLGLKGTAEKTEANASQAQNLLDQARDLCIQARYQKASELLSKAEQM